MPSVTRNRFLIKTILLIESTSSPLWRQITWHTDRYKSQSVQSHWKQSPAADSWNVCSRYGDFDWYIR